MLRVGLTGGIACGKSRVLGRLAAAGFHTLDLDAIAHEMMAPGGPAYQEVLQAFGRTILAPDGTVDRRRLGALVFGDAAARSRLNAVVHPYVREQEARLTAPYSEDPRAIVMTDAALLVEAGVHLRFDRLVVVHCEPAEQLRRLMERDSIDAAAARARIAAQMPVEEKRRFAHHEVDSAGSLEDTDRAADRLANELRNLTRVRAPRVKLSLERCLGCLIHGPRRGPRGLEPERVVREIVAARGLEMEPLARLLKPPARDVWYRAARPRERGPGPETLAGPLVLLCLARGAPDPPWLLAAAHSLAHLTHPQPAALAEACLFVQVLLDVALEGRLPGDLLERWAGWSTLAERWAGVPPSERLVPVLRAALAHPTDPAIARRAADETGGDPDLAGSLVGMASGIPLGQAPVPLVELLQSLIRLQPPR